MPAEGLSYLEQVRSRREARGSHSRGEDRESALDPLLVTCTWLLWAGGRSRSRCGQSGAAAGGQPREADTLLWGRGGREWAEPGAGERRRGGGGGWRSGGSRKRERREKERKKRDRERQERKLIKGCSPQTGKRLGRKRNRRLRQSNKQDTEGKQNFDDLPFCMTF